MSSTARAPLFRGAPFFAFPALAANAAESPLGGDREVAMACLLGARLALGMITTAGGGRTSGALDLPRRRSRANGARTWLASHAFSARMRSAIERLFEATAQDDPRVTARHLRTVSELAGSRLDLASRYEITRLTESLESAAGVAGSE